MSWKARDPTQAVGNLPRTLYLEMDILKYTYMTTQVFMTPVSNHIKIEGLARPIGLLIRQQFYVSTSNVGLCLEGHI